MRYAITGMEVSELRRRLDQVGARDIKVTPLTRQAFCDLTEDQVARLRSMGLKVRPIGETRVTQAPLTAVAPAGIIPGVELARIRTAFTPPITGVGLTAAVLDSGVRKTHQELTDKVIYEANFSGAPTVEDRFNHGTPVASIIAGSRYGISPGAVLMNIKVLDDRGVGTDETVVAGIEEVCRLVKEATEKGIHPTSPEYPNVINLSCGGPDDEDPDSPMKLAARTAKEEYGVEVIAAAGNKGPEMSSIMSPASDPSVIAVGGTESRVLQLWEHSSRGPTLCGDVKPDFVVWATDIQGASAESDDAYTIKDGTSFSTPILTGVRGFLDEAIRRSYGRDFSLPWSQIMAIAPLVCVKPWDVPMKKDNNWGYGLPMFAAITQRLTRPPFDISPFFSLIGLAMMTIATIRMARIIKE